ncbi:hypothetical protein C8T65DRAFT_73394 [Cerioporus squamosus]|nr:hypothetical protein C8T65DRAFT_73394 [Cerioporus squamosus]
MHFLHRVLLCISPLWETRPVSPLRARLPIFSCLETLPAIETHVTLPQSVFLDVFPLQGLASEPCPVLPSLTMRSMRFRALPEHSFSDWNDVRLGVDPDRYAKKSRSHSLRIAVDASRCPRSARLGYR